MNGRDYILKIGSQVLGPEFNLDDPFRDQLYRDLFYYFAGNPASNYSLDHSILMCGSLGVGKSVLVKVMQRAFPRIMYRLTGKNMKKMVMQNGPDQTIKDFGYTFKKDLLIDDLGTEDPSKRIYGDTPDIFVDLFYEREELYQDSHKSIKTHVITNLTTDEMEAAYGDRILDRILGMAKQNLIVWQGDSLRTNYHGND